MRVGEACKVVRDDTEKSMHAVCSMVEDIAKIASKSELILASKVPLIDHFYSTTVQLNQKLESHDLELKDLKQR